MCQNKYLMEHCAIYSRDNREASEKMCTTNDSISFSNKNNYSGLMSLRSRMALSEQMTQDAIADYMADESTTDTTAINSIGIDTPVYFYFKCGTSQLVDETQLANLDELAHLASQQHLNVCIKGAADSDTGSKGMNKRLSKKRAHYIAKELLRRGVTKTQMHVYSLGGIHEFVKSEANRFTLVMLSREQKDICQ